MQQMLGLQDLAPSQPLPGARKMAEESISPAQDATTSFVSCWCRWWRRQWLPRSAVSRRRGELLGLLGASVVADLPKMVGFCLVSVKNQRKNGHHQEKDEPPGYIYIYMVEVCHPRPPSPAMVMVALNRAPPPPPPVGRLGLQGQGFERRTPVGERPFPPKWGGYHCRGRGVAARRPEPYIYIYI